MWQRWGQVIPGIDSAREEKKFVIVELNQRFSESEWMTASDRMWAKCKEECRIEMSEFMNKAVTSGKINIKTAKIIVACLKRLLKGTSYPRLASIELLLYQMLI